MKDIEIARKYFELVSKFVSHRVSASDFEEHFTAEFLNEPGEVMSDTLYLILEDLFEHVDCFCYELLPEEETAWEISEPTLRKQANETLQYLRKYWAGLPIDTTLLKERVGIWWENLGERTSKESYN